MICMRYRNREEVNDNYILTSKPANVVHTRRKEPSIQSFIIIIISMEYGGGHFKQQKETWKRLPENAFFKTVNIHIFLLKIKLGQSSYRQQGNIFFYFFNSIRTPVIIILKCTKILRCKTARMINKTAPLKIKSVSPSVENSRRNLY